MFTNIATGFSALVNVSEQRSRLKYLENNVQDPVLVKKVKKSYKSIIWITILILFILIGIFTAMILNLESTYGKYTSQNTRTGYLSGEKVWYVENIKRELTLSDYGLDYNNFNNGSTFTIVLDKENNVIEVLDKEKFDAEKNKKIYLIVGMLPLSLIVLLLTVPLSKKTYGKAWSQYGKWYYNKSKGLDNGEFNLN